MTNNPRTILIAGHFGFRNSGDEAILLSMIHDLRNSYKDINFQVISGDPQLTKLMLGVDAISWVDIQAIRNAVEKCSLVLLGGGGLFHDYWGFEPNTTLTSNHSGLSYFYGITLLSKLLKKPLMIYAVGVGPLLNDVGKFYTCLSFENADFITVRDQESKKILEKLGINSNDIYLTADPAFGLDSKIKEIINDDGQDKSNPVLCVAIRNWGFLNWEAEVSKALDEFIEKYNAKIRFLSFQDQENLNNNDNQAAKRIMKGIEHKDCVEIIEKSLSISEKTEIILNSDFVLGMRLHSIIFSIILGIPFIGISYDKKVGNLIKRIGLEKYCLEIEKINSENLSNLLDQLIINKKSFFDGTSGKIDEMKYLARKNATYAIEILNSKPKEMSLINLSEVPNALLLSYISKIENLRSHLLQSEKTVNYLNQQMKSEIQKRDESVFGYKEELQRVVEERDESVFGHKEELQRVVEERDESVFGYKEELQRVVEERDESVFGYKEELQKINVEYQNNKSMQKSIIQDKNSQIANLKMELFSIHSSIYWKARSLISKIFHGTKSVINNNKSTKYLE